MKILKTMEAFANIRTVYNTPDQRSIAYLSEIYRDYENLINQDFIPNNTFDIRVIVIDNKAFAIKRLTRKNDFRASGSGMIVYRKKEIDERCVKIAFEVNEKVKSQSIAFDFVFDAEHNPLILEISYGFVAEGYDPCEGYWDKDLTWHEGSFNPYGWMVDNLVCAK